MATNMTKLGEIIAEVTAEFALNGQEMSDLDFEETQYEADNEDHFCPGTDNEDDYVLFGVELPD